MGHKFQYPKITFDLFNFDFNVICFLVLYFYLVNLFDYSSNPTHAEAEAYAKKIQKQMENKTMDELLNLNQTTDERVTSLLGMLLTMFDTTYFINIDLYLTKG